MGEHPKHVKRKLIFEGLRDCQSEESTENAIPLQSIDKAEHNLSSNVLVQVCTKLSEIDSAVTNTNKLSLIGRESNTDQPISNNDLQNESVSDIGPCCNTNQPISNNDLQKESLLIGPCCNTNQPITNKDLQNESVSEIAEMFCDNISPTIMTSDVAINDYDQFLISSLENDLGKRNITEDIHVLQDNGKQRQKQKQKRQERATVNRKSYFEFISDNEDPFFTDGDSSSWHGSSDSDESKKATNKKKSKKNKLSMKNTVKSSEKNDDIEIVVEKGYRKKKQNIKKNRKEAKQKGEEYIKSNGSIRKQREMKPNPCTGKKCGNDCQVIPEDRRLSLFKHFWSLTSERQRDWLIYMSRKTDIKRKRNKDSGRRLYSFEYFINHNEDRRKVCQQFLLNTLDITQTYVYYTLANASQGSSKDDLRGKTIPANKTKEETVQSVINFIKKLPALPSHYCRKDSSKLYLPVEFKNQKNVYRIYKDQKTSEGVDVVSEKIFLNIFKTEFNIGFHIPKKDKCIKCMKFDALNTEESKAHKKEHLKEKDGSKQRYSHHRELAQKRNDIVCASFDLQKVLNTPYGESMLLYYSRKYAIYNLCFYENGTRDGFCYIWGESEGKRGGNEVSSIIEKYIQLVDARGTVKHLILYSDSCPGQNKNRTVLAAIHNALKHCENLTSIQMNYLLPGHTEMSVDSMHSVIEGSVKNTIVWAPSQWVTVCQLARKEPRPYNVHYLDHTDFQGYDEFSDKYFRGNLIGKISKLRIVTFKKSNLNVMAVKYSMLSDAAEENITINGASTSQIVKQIYKKSIPITQKKYEDLTKLCKSFAIPRLFHNEYVTLPHVDGVDTLAESDIEDVL